jgi:Glu-tRNA(Gln) amidotransferase subunit E-like FAD-binding protein
MQVSMNLKINQLRKIAGDMGLSAGGSKEELVERINNAQSQPATPNDHFRTEIARVADILVDYPEAITVRLSKVSGRHVYQFADQSQAGTQAREKISEILGNLWQSGAYNFEEIARALRVQPLDIQGLIDVEFANKNNL